MVNISMLGKNTIVSREIKVEKNGSKFMNTVVQDEQGAIHTVIIEFV